MTIRSKQPPARYSRARRCSAAPTKACRSRPDRGSCEYPYEQITRDCRILTIFEGTNEVLRLYIALSALKDLGKTYGELRTAVDTIFNHPIKGFGVLSDYAGQRLTQATGVGRARITAHLPAGLRDTAALYERYTVALSRACDFLLRRHGRAIADQQHALKRVADIVIDLFVGLCVTSRAATMTDGPAAEAEQAAGIARVFAQQAKRRMASNIRRIERNEDPELERLAGFILDNGRYPWDVLQ